jgi:hypothetical protein
MLGARLRGPWRTPSISKKPAAIGPETPGATSMSTNVSRESRCSFASTSSGRSTGVHTIPRRCASAETSSIVIVLKCSVYIGISTSAFWSRATNDSKCGSANASGLPSHSHIARHWRGESTTSRT